MLERLNNAFPPSGGSLATLPTSCGTPLAPRSAVGALASVSIPDVRAGDGVEFLMLCGRRNEGTDGIKTLEIATAGGGRGIQQPLLYDHQRCSIHICAAFLR